VKRHRNSWSLKPSLGQTQTSGHGHDSNAARAGRPGPAPEVCRSVAEEGPVMTKSSVRAQVAVRSRVRYRGMLFVTIARLALRGRSAEDL
jgi:hypothetical protein